MALPRWFRLCSYVTLGLSCSALVFAESAFLPVLQACLPPVLALLVLAWWVEGRWGLPSWGVNVLAALIGGGAVLWLAMQATDPESWASQVPLRLATVPYTGPLLMAALLVKVFQPRRAGDFWRVQGLGLAQVGLGCVLDDGPEFGAVVAAYAVSGVACLALHHRLSVLPAPGHAEAPRAVSGAEGSWWLVRFTFRWALLVGGLALVLFLVTPRPDAAAWESFNNFRSRPHPPPAMPSGAAGEINLNGVGTVELDDGVALQVTVTDAAGRPKDDLPAEQRWRGGVLERYEYGRWTPAHLPPGMLPWRPVRGQVRLPDFGPDQRRLTFLVQPRRSGGLVLADPIRFGPPSAPLPVVPLDEGRPAMFFEVGGTVLSVFLSARQEYRYRQILPGGADPERTPARGLRPGTYPERLTSQAVPGLREWTVDLLRRLSLRAGYELPAAVRADLSHRDRAFLVEPEHWEEVARVLTRYLAFSGEYSYTLVLTRRDLTLDPVMDFLLNLREGHCERYATALALMLRAVGIPSRVVKGYRGAENQGEGTYVVRHLHAHAWVEILVPPERPDGAPYDWLTLDPTPGESAPRGAAFSLAEWWEEGQRSALRLWQTLIVDYNSDQQAGLLDHIKNGRRLAALRKIIPPALGAGGLLGALLVLRRWRRRRAGRFSASAPPFYSRLLALLARHAALRPGLAQTPREFAEDARQFLRQRPALAELAEVPGRAADCLYQVRFGGRPLQTAEEQALDAELDQLAEALRRT